VREFPEELGKHLEEFVLRRIQNSDRPPQQFTIPTRLVIRQSAKRFSSSEPQLLPARVPALSSVEL
jgi:LacI family transcriptional regulator